MATDVSSIIDNAQSTAKDMATKASAMVDSAAKMFDTRYEIMPGNIPLDLPTVDFDVGIVPQYQGTHFIAPAPPGPPPAQIPLPNPPMPIPPTNKATKEPRDPLNTPSEVREFTAVAPTLDQIIIPPAPDALSNLNFEAPTITDVVVPKAPVVTPPEFTAQRPTTTLEDPGNVVDQFRMDFSDQGASLRASLEGAVDAQLAKINPRFKEQMAAIEDQLATYIKGGTGLKPEVEDAIFARSLDKTGDEYRRVRDTVYAEGANRGFTMPTGAMFSAAMQARQTMADANARAAMDIAIKQAELEQANLQFAVTQSMNLRQTVINASMQWAGTLVELNAQALQFAQGVLKAVVDLYDIKVKIVQSQVEVYKAEAQVYQYRLQAVLAVYDVYKAQIDALQAQVGVDTAKVQAFSARMNGIGALANAYKAVVDGIATKAQIEKLKVDAFGAEVQAYSAQVAANTAAWQGYKARVEGNVALVDAYRAEVQAYNSEVDAYKAQIEARATQIQAASTANETAARTYAVGVQAYTALVQGQSAAVSAEINSFESTIKAWTAGMNAKEARARLAVTNSAEKGRVTVAAYQQQANMLIQNAELSYKRMTDMANVATAGAGVYANMTASALAGINSMAAAIETQNL